MNLHEILQALATLNMKGDVQYTKHPDYIRCYAINCEGVSLGRITVFRGQYDHVKWYTKEYGMLSKWDYERYAWAFLINHKVVISREDYDAAVEEATKMALKVHDDKIEWRKNNPKFGKNGELKNRRKLWPANPRGYVYNVLLETLPKA